MGLSAERAYETHTTSPRVLQGTEHIVTSPEGDEYCDQG